MAFASIHIPGFQIQAVVRSEPALRHRAIALVDGTSPLWTVIAANDAALQAGIQLGMAKSQAAQFCAIEIRHRSQPQEKAAHAALLDLGWSISPRIEDTAPDTILADIAGLASLFGSPENIAHEFSARASVLGLTANVVIASTINAALLASRGFPRNHLDSSRRGAPETWPSPCPGAPRLSRNSWNPRSLGCRYLCGAGCVASA